MFYQLIAACFCDILILFMFCFGGEMIIDAFDISTDVYKIRWYEYDERAKYIIRLMMARAQKPYQFADYKTINCCSAAFINVKPSKLMIRFLFFSIYSFFFWEKNISIACSISFYFQIIQKASAAFTMLKSI